MQLLLFAIGLLLAGSIHADTTQRCSTAAKAVDTAKQSKNPLADLSLRLYAAINALTPNENLIFSPASIGLGLSLLEAGASGQTRSQIQQFLMTQGSNADTVAVYQALQHHLKINTPKVELTIANGIYTSPNFSIKDDYKTIVQQCYESKIETTNFAQNAEGSRARINRFVSDATNSKIPELFKQGDITPDTVAALVNALYFKALWSDPFNKNSITQETFYAHGRTAKTVPFLVDYSRTVRTVSKPTYDVIELPFIGDDVLSMYFIVPKARDGVDQVARSLTASDIAGIQDSMTYKALKLYLPKFYTRTNVNLKTVLKNMGMTSMFMDTADFSRMTTGAVKVSKAVHEAFIKVHENGTEAAAATGFTIIPKSAMPPREPTKIDHPFIYYIIHKPTGAPIFMGKIVDIVEEPQ